MARLRRRSIALVALGGLLALALPTRAGGGADLVVIVNPANDEAVSPRALESYFRRESEHWDSGVKVMPLNSPPDSDARHAFNHAALAMSPDEVVRYWLDQRIRSGKSAPREIADPALLLKLVARFPGAIAYVPASSAVRDVRVVARIHDDKVLPP